MFGNFLKLQVNGTSHGPSISMKLEHFPCGFPVDMKKLQTFLERRAPGQNKLSTQRKEADIPLFQSGIKDNITSGDAIEAIILNSDARSADYPKELNIPRPGHADYTQWIQSGRILPGGGKHSGRLTAPLCIAGGICLQWLEKRGITIQGKLLSAGGNATAPEDAIRTAAEEGDSVGGIIELHVHGLLPGLGGPLFQGLDSALAAAMFTIPGVKGIEFGSGFELASMRGSQANDTFCIQDGRIVTQSNHHGGLLGGITTGMPLVFRLAMKPTPSIFQQQRSIDLSEKCPALLCVKGRHDPCIALRAIPVAEAMAAFTLADAMLADEAKRPRICLTLTEHSLERALSTLKKNMPFVEMCELRVDYLEQDQQLAAADFQSKAGMPVILTVRRNEDGGTWNRSEQERIELLEHLLNNGFFSYVDLEDDCRYPNLDAIARKQGTQIIRSHHDFNGPVTSLIERMRQIKGNTNDIPKLAFAVKTCSDMERLFRETANFTEFPHIICAMGNMGQLSRILAVKTHSMLTFTSSKEALEKQSFLGHLSPETLVKTYRFRSLTNDTKLFAVTGWPLGHTLSPQLNNEAFHEEDWNAVMFPLPSESAEDTLRCAEALDIRGIAVTVPHKKAMLSLATSVTERAKNVGAVNTLIRTQYGWHGDNTDVIGFQKALCAFLEQTDLTGCKVAILGAGGAANAIAYVIHQLHGNACIFNRTLSKAQQLAAQYDFKAAPLDENSADLLAEYGQLIIQTTSVGLSSSNDTSNDPIPFYQFKGHESLYDLIYSPAETPLMARARNAGCHAENGLSMLIEQAREQRRLYKDMLY